MTPFADKPPTTPSQRSKPVPPQLHPSTVAITAGRGTKTPGDPTNVPVTLSSTFHPGGERIYGREGNPNWTALEEVLGALEGGRALLSIRQGWAR